MSDVANGLDGTAASTDAADAADVAGRWVEWVAQGGITRDFLGVDAQQMEAAYHYATQLYRQKRYQDAAILFAFLSMQNQWESRYLLGMAGCAQMLGRFQDALSSYGTAASLDMSDPMPQFRIAECLVALKMREEAVETLRFVVDLADAPEHVGLRARARAMRDWLMQEKTA